MNEPINTIEYKTHTIEVYIDDCPEDPREWDNLGTIMTTKFWQEVDYLKIAGSLKEAILDKAEVIEDNGGVILPIYCYSHGIDRFKTTSFHGCGLPQGHARFDSGICGFIFVELDKIRKEYGVKRVTKKIRERATKVLEAEIETIDQYSSGQVYGYKLFDKSGEEIDSCWGYFGDMDYMLNEVKGQVDYIMMKPHTRQPVMELLGA